MHPFLSRTMTGFAGVISAFAMHSQAFAETTDQVTAPAAGATAEIQAPQPGSIFNIPSINGAPQAHEQIPEACEKTELSRFVTRGVSNVGYGIRPTLDVQTLVICKMDEDASTKVSDILGYSTPQFQDLPFYMVTASISSQNNNLSEEAESALIKSLGAASDVQPGILINQEGKAFVVGNIPNIPQPNKTLAPAIQKAVAQIETERRPVVLAATNPAQFEKVNFVSSPFNPKTDSSNTLKEFAVTGPTPATAAILEVAANPAPVQKILVADLKPSALNDIAFATDDSASTMPAHDVNTTTPRIILADTKPQDLPALNSANFLLIKAQLATTYRLGEPGPFQYPAPPVRSIAAMDSIKPFDAALIPISAPLLPSLNSTASSITAADDYTNLYALTDQAAAIPAPAADSGNSPVYVKTNSQKFGMADGPGNIRLFTAFEQAGKSKPHYKILGGAYRPNDVGGDWAIVVDHPTDDIAKAYFQITVDPNDPGGQRIFTAKAIAPSGKQLQDYLVKQEMYDVGTFLIQGTAYDLSRQFGKPNNLVQKITYGSFALEYTAPSTEVTSASTPTPPLVVQPVEAVGAIIIASRNSSAPVETASFLPLPQIQKTEAIATEPVFIAEHAAAIQPRTEKLPSVNAFAVAPQYIEAAKTPPQVAEIPPAPIAVEEQGVPPAAAQPDPDTTKLDGALHTLFGATEAGTKPSVNSYGDTPAKTIAAMAPIPNPSDVIRHQTDRNAQKRHVSLAAKRHKAEIAAQVQTIKSRIAELAKNVAASAELTHSRMIAADKLIKDTEQAIKPYQQDNLISGYMHDAQTQISIIRHDADINETKQNIAPFYETVEGAEVNESAADSVDRHALTAFKKLKVDTYKARQIAARKTANARLLKYVEIAGLPIAAMIALIAAGTRHTIRNNNNGNSPFRGKKFWNGKLNTRRQPKSTVATDFAYVPPVAPDTDRHHDDIAFVRHYEPDPMQFNPSLYGAAALAMPLASPLDVLQHGKHHIENAQRIANKLVHHVRENKASIGASVAVSSATGYITGHALAGLGVKAAFVAAAHAMTIPAAGFIGSAVAIVAAGAATGIAAGMAGGVAAKYVSSARQQGKWLDKDLLVQACKETCTWNNVKNSAIFGATFGTIFGALGHGLGNHHTSISATSPSHVSTLMQPLHTTPVSSAPAPAATIAPLHHTTLNSLAHGQDIVNKLAHTGHIQEAMQMNDQLLQSAKDANLQGTVVNTLSKNAPYLAAKLASGLRVA